MYYLTVVTEKQTAAIYPIGAIKSQHNFEQVIWISYLFHDIHHKQIRGYLDCQDVNKAAYFI